MKMKGWSVLVLGAMICVTPSEAQDPALVLADGGLQFPDGTVQLTAAAKGYAPVEDTGQKQCWDSHGDLVECSLTGQDGDLQKGVDWPTPRFSNNFNGTFTDNLTGLIWLQDAECFGLMTWQEALTAVLNFALGGRACQNYPAQFNLGWRLPNVKELTSLIDYGQVGLALPVGHPFIDVQLSWYWSSSSYVFAPNLAWEVFLYDGLVGVADKGDDDYVWPVRGGQ